MTERRDSSGSVQVDTTEPMFSAGLAWETSYDRASVERFMHEIQTERLRLEAEIEAADTRVVVAKARTAALHNDARAELGGLVLAAQRELSAIERESQDLIASIRNAAETEAARLLATARAEAAEMRATALSIAQAVSGGETPTVDRDEVDGSVREAPSTRTHLDAG